PRKAVPHPQAGMDLVQLLVHGLGPLHGNPARGSLLDTATTGLIPRETIGIHEQNFNARAGQVICGEGASRASADHGRIKIVTIYTHRGGRPPVESPTFESILRRSVGRTPWSAAGPLAGLSGTRASRADQGVRPTRRAMTHEKSKLWFERAQARIPGGVNSPVRAFRGVGGEPRFIDRGEGSR